MATLFLGGGRITGALAAGLRLAGDSRTIVVYDRNPEKVRALRRASRVEIARDLKSAVARAEMMVVAVRPASVSEVLDELIACGARPRLCVSLAAGVPLAVLRAKLGRPARWVRAMPSPVCRVARGLTGLCFDRGVAKSERTRVQGLFERLGQVIEIPERQFDAFTATFSSSHGYHAVVSLAKAARGVGLDSKTALMVAGHALGDGILYWRESGDSLPSLLQEAATPGGTAAATMAAMDRAGYARVLASGLKAGIGQARRNARGWRTK